MKILEVIVEIKAHLGHLIGVEDLDVNCSQVGLAKEITRIIKEEEIIKMVKTTRTPDKCMVNKPYMHMTMIFFQSQSMSTMTHDLSFT